MHGRSPHHSHHQPVHDWGREFAMSKKIKIRKLEKLETTYLRNGNG
jgi:hypothetical protein